MNKHKKITLFILVSNAIIFFFLADILFNPYILWTSLPLYISYVLIKRGIKADSNRLLLAAYSFMLISIGFSIFITLPGISTGKVPERAVLARR